jgi:hypothetical protein
VDAEVMRRVRKVALDTARGRTLTLAGHLRAAGDAGAPLESLALYLGETDQCTLQLLNFLKKIHVAARVKKPSMQATWRLTGRFAALWAVVMEEQSSA